MNNLRLEEYHKAFIFGVKLVVLLSLLVLPPVIGFTLSSWADNLTQKFPLLYTPELKLTQVQDFEFKYTPQYWTSVDLTSGKKIYFAVNRAISGLDEYKRATDEVLDILNNTYSTEKIPVIDKDTKTEKGISYSFPSYSGTAIYGCHTKIGNFVIIPINIVLFIVCLALYFPLIKAIINLFRRKKIFG